MPRIKPPSITTGNNGNSEPAVFDPAQNLIPWQPGQSGNPDGRPRGSRALLATEYFENLYEAWQRSGKAALDTMAMLYPNEFVKVVSSHMPRETHATIVNVKLERMSDRQLLEAIARADILGEIATRRIAAPEQDPPLADKLDAA